MRAKNTTIASIYISFNFIEVFRPRCNVDMQFSERYSQPSQIMIVSCQQQLLGTNAYCGSAYGAVFARKSGMAGANKTQTGSELENLETRYIDQWFYKQPGIEWSLSI